MKPKQANTLQQKLGFFDDDLKKPLHDEIMLKLNDKIEDIVNELFYKPLSENELEKLKDKAIRVIDTFIKDRTILIDYYRKCIEEYSKKDSSEDYARWTKEYEEKLEVELNKIAKYKDFKGFNNKPERPRIKLKQKIWELPVTTQSHYSSGYSSGSSNKYTVGFIDMAVSFDQINFDIGGITTERITRPDDKWITNIAKNLYFETILEERWLYIEVKTEIKSVGELIRQIQHYKEYKSGSYYVVCPDNKYKDILQEQGIGTIEI